MSTPNIKIKKVKIEIRVLIYKTIWFWDGLMSKISRKKLLAVNKVLPNEALENILILAPHADDEWIGCSQAIKLSKKSTVYYFNFLGKNYNSQNEKIRLEEIKKVSKINNSKLVISSSRENYFDLKKLINDENFSAIFIPFPLDWHPEHLKVNDIAIDIISDSVKSSNLYFYHISVPIPETIKEYVYLPMSKSEIQNKIKVFDQNYISQRNTPIRRLALQNRIWAQGQKFYAAEVYAKFEINEWKKFLNFVHDNFQKIRESINFIDFPLKIKEISNDIYLNFNKKRISS